ncbi:GIY-YIG nuclease family protein [Gloeocapsopsis crepidinum LEGE 06123]|uniref:GIY-YIG nuclease family protein n=1 Tax=Gloeocapsopsis crepidinum LEGE 06123 TaxID=588587 RepID=A0ABR9UST1_9CHRO|nr:GIY-YIG nuclease family protein [Gloeocapsopsis crepidinum]MBE9190675.1 GIY-YIG nuclease family protein [Gloeocapsopsis crepidinum LEGE 06123]
MVSSFEDIIASKLLGGRCTLRQRALLPSISGIYFVTDERNYLLYVGKATNLQSRWAGSGHHRYKQFARKGLDKIAISYVLAPIAELDHLERQYIAALKPLLNNGRVKKYLPKKSPRLSELQRLLKLANAPLFPSCKFTTDRQGNIISRPAWDLFRGFVAGTYTANNHCCIVIVCQQNMGEILYNSSTHKIKRRFYIQDQDVWKIPGAARYAWLHGPIWKFDARQVVFEFIEFFTLGNYLFEQLYPHLIECQVASVSMRKLPYPSSVTFRNQQVLDKPFHPEE